VFLPASADLHRSGGVYAVAGSGVKLNAQAPDTTGDRSRPADDPAMGKVAGPGLKAVTGFAQVVSPLWLFRTDAE
jgi:hypothetical protein